MRNRLTDQRPASSVLFHLDLVFPQGQSWDQHRPRNTSDPQTWDIRGIARGGATCVCVVSVGLPPTFGYLWADFIAGDGGVVDGLADRVGDAVEDGDAPSQRVQ